MPFEESLFLFRSHTDNRDLIRLNLLEAGLLYRLAQQSSGNIVEIGTKYGGSAVLLATAIDDSRKVYTVDIADWPRRKETIHRTPKHLLRRIEFLKGDSVEVSKKWTAPIGLLFVDGRHNEVFCRADVNAWSKFLTVNGYIVFHDTLDYRVRKKTHKGVPALRKVIKQNLKNYQVIAKAQSMIALQKLS